MSRLLLIGAALFGVMCPSAAAGTVTVPMRDALDNYAAEYAHEQGWEYVDRLATLHGDYRRAYATLIFTTTYEGRADGHKITVPATWEVEARVARCGPGWYAVSTPGGGRTCPPVFRLPAWG